MNHAGQERRTRRLALWLIVGSGAFHLVYSAFVGLAGDEAYYWQWARHPDWGYYDHPPMVAWLIAIGVKIAGHNAFGVRLASNLMSAGILWFVYQLTVYASAILVSRQSDSPAPAQHGLWAVIVLLVMPLFSVGGFLATPDVPLAFFWIWSLLLTVQAAEHPRPRTWVLLGVALACGMLSKYSMLVLPLSLLITFVMTSRGRLLLKTPGPYLAAATALLIFLPHLFWLAQHDFVSMSYQLGHGLGGGSRSGLQRLGTFLQFVGTQIGVVSPLLFLLFVIALARSVRQLLHLPADNHARRLTGWLLVVPAMLTLLVFAVASLFAKPQANWPAMAYLSLSVLSATLLVNYIGAMPFKKFSAWAAVTLAASISVYAHLEAVYPMVPFGNSVFDKLQDKKGLAEWFQGLRTGRGEEGMQAAVLADNYRQASLLAFYLPDHPETDAPFERGSGEQYSLWRQQAAPAVRKAWYITRFEADPRLAVLFSNYQAAGEYTERRLGIKLGMARIYYGDRREAK